MITPSGNAARDHLANERTVLAYVRTALGLVLLGVVGAQVGGGQSGQALVAVVFSSAVVVLLLGTIRYLRVHYTLTNSDFYESGVWAMLVVLILSLTVSVVFIVHTFEK